MEVTDQNDIEVVAEWFRSWIYADVRRRNLDDRRRRDP